MAREYKDSGIEWIGQIPKEWEQYRIKYNTFLKGRIGWQGLNSSDFLDEGYCLIDGKDFLNKLVGNNKFSSFASTINEVKISYGQLVAYSAKGDKAGNSNGLAFHTPILGYDYPQNQSNLTNWKALFDNL